MSFLLLKNLWHVSHVKVVLLTVTSSCLAVAESVTSYIFTLFLVQDPNPSLQIDLYVSLSLTSRFVFPVLHETMYFH